MHFTQCILISIRTTNHMKKKKQKKATTKAIPISKPSIQERIKERWNNPVFRFLGLSIIGIALFYLFYISLYETMLEAPITAFNAWLSSAVLNLIGYGTTVQDAAIHGTFSLNVKRGCDAIEPIAVMGVILLAFPMAIRHKLSGVLVGILVLAALNILRIVSLYLIGIYVPSIFELMHMQIWQVLFILAALVFSAFWIRRGLQKANLQNTTN